jgi:type II secretory pathway pseudopilin PulG
MIEVAVAIAIIAILAGAVAPLALKALNQQREQKTRENMEIAWRALFGSRDRRVSNMRADFGFNPTAPATQTLGPMAANTLGVRGYGADAAAGYNWGWNGAYWTGSINAGLPLDGWGRNLLLLRTGPVVTPSWQLRSYGANGRDDLGAGDDLSYPASPMSASSMAGTIIVNLQRTNLASLTADIPFTVTLTDRFNMTTRTTVWSPIVPPSTTGMGVGAATSNTFTVVSGPTRVRVQAVTPAIDTSQVLDLLPAETQVLTFKFD